MRYYLGVDIGTYESKGVLVDAEGRIVARAARAHKMLVPQPGWAEHRPEEDWWGDFCFVTKAVIAESGVDPAEIKAVAASAIGPCMLPVDADGMPLMNGVLYGVDTRAVDEIAELTGRIGEDRLLARCGNALTSQSVGPKILWLKHKRPELYAQTARVMTATSYVVGKLTGRIVIDHYSAGSWAPLYDADKNAWVDDLADDIVGLEKLPELLWTTEVAGEVTPEAAAATGLKVGTPVTAGTIDAGAEGLSVGAVGVGDMLLMYGSTMYFQLITAARVQDARLWYAPGFFPGEHTAMAGLATSGTLSHWFREQFARELDPETAVVQLAAEAETSPPGARGLVLLPYFSGERTPMHDTEAKGVLFGLDLTHTRADIYRAVFEGIAMGTRHVFETYAEANQQISALYAAGGGTKNRVWSAATSDIGGVTQIVREQTLGASYGDAFLAALAIGDVRREDIGQWNPVARHIAPDPGHEAVYTRQYRVFRELYSRNRDLMAELGATL